jgi:ABC-type Na+ efflux pump permease subunit
MDKRHFQLLAIISLIAGIVLVVMGAISSSSANSVSEAGTPVAMIMFGMWLMIMPAPLLLYAKHKYK